MAFPFELLKAETLRSISLDLLQGTSGKSYLISRTRDTNIAFLKSVAEHGGAYPSLPARGLHTY